MVYYCAYCGVKSDCPAMCQKCKEKVRLIRKIKAMLRPYVESKKARERLAREKELNYGNDKDLHEH